MPWRETCVMDERMRFIERFVKERSKRLERLKTDVEAARSG